MNFKSWMIYLIMGLALLAADAKNGLQPQGSGEMDSVLASVNGEPICLSDILPMTRSKEYQAYASLSGNQLAEKIKNLRLEAVNELIDRKLIIADYIEHQFKLNPGDIEFELDRATERLGCQSRKELISKLESQGYSFDEFRRDIENNLRYQFMVYRQLSNTDFITPREIFEYFNKNREKFSAPQQVDLAMLRFDNKVSGEQLDKIAETLRKNPRSFEELCKQQGSSGSIGVVDCDNLRPEFIKAIKDFNRQDVIGPIKVEEGTVWLKILKHIPARGADFHQLSGQIGKELHNNRRREVLNNYTAELRAKAVITYFIVNGGGL